MHNNEEKVVLDFLDQNPAIWPRDANGTVGNIGVISIQGDEHNYGKSTSLLGKCTISMAIFQFAR